MFQFFAFKLARIYCVIIEKIPIIKLNETIIVAVIKCESVKL